MKKSLFSIVFGLVFMLGYGQTTIFNEAGGGSEPTGWTFENNVTSNVIDKGSYWLVEDGATNDFIITSSFDLSSYASAEFSLDVATFGGGNANPARIEFSFDGGANYTQTEVTNTPSSSSYINGGTYTLNSVTNQVVIRISSNGSSGRDVRLRNLELVASGTGGSSYTATFDSNSGSGSMSPQTESSAANLKANTFTRTGYTFAGWNTAANGSGTSYADGATFPFSANTTLYAQWTAIGGGGGTCANETFTNIPSSSSTSYLSRTWTGDDGVSWTATNSKTDQTISGAAITMNDDVATTYVESGTYSGGIGDLTITTQRKFSGGSGNLNVVVNGSNVGTVPYGENPITTTISGINVSGNIVLRIENNIGGSNGGGADRVAIDDLTWTCYSGGSASTCSITSLTAASPSACVPVTGTYSVDVTVEYSDAPASGNLEVNGQTFAITSSPQTVTLTNLVADGNPVDVTALFSDEPSCTLTEAALFTSPAGCAPDVIINEYMADPDPTNGDANGDGTVDVVQDEFIEFYNNEAYAVDISGWTITDNIDIRHTFPASTIVPAGGFITVFGGGTPTGINGIIQTANGYQNVLSLNNSGDNITLASHNGVVVASFSYGTEADNDQSLARDPDLTGSFVEHTTICGVLGRLYSPGEFNVVATPTCNITSSASDMCAGDTRVLTADSPGTSFSGTGVSGNTFTAPTPFPLSNADYTITATNGCCTSTQTITVYANPEEQELDDRQACINNAIALPAQGSAVGTGIWTWSPTAPQYSTGNANTANAQVVFSIADSYTGTWTVENGVCNSTIAETVINVRSAATSTSLFNAGASSSAAVTATEACVEGGWTYYADQQAAPDEYLFAINKNGNSFSAFVQIDDLPGTTTIASLGGSPAIRGTWLIGRYWNATILSGSITTPVDVRFFVDPAEVTQAENEATSFLNSTAAATNMTSLTFFKTVSAAFDPATSLVNGEFTFAPAYLPYTTGTLNGVTYYELTGLTSFSGGTGGFSVNDSGSPLPVELLGFDVNAVDNQFIRLDWATASEINNEGFEVLRSTDGVYFERIAWIDGNGNSTEINEYVFNDWGVDKGITYYYQLKQIDYDGQDEYFDIKSARLDGKTTFTVGALVPNPSKGNDMVSVDISTSSGELLTVEIYDRIGAKVKSTSYVLFAAENALDINISDLAEGTYFLNFESSMGTETRKLVILK